MQELHPNKVPLRSPSQVMKLSRMGSAHAHRLSFMRILMRRMQRENWRIEATEFVIDGNGVGHAVYTAHTPNRTYSLVAFSHDLPAELRSDRVIAEAWDCTFTLFDGIPTPEDVKRLSQNVPHQEAGRISKSELSLSRANRSVRLWAHVVERLANGLQPDPQMINDVGYLMRTTAVYGSGKFGAADRQDIADRAEFAAPFQSEMLSVYLTRTFVMDLVEHIARAKGGKKAVVLDPVMRRQFGIGNSTGLGMAPFILNHPILLNNWVASKEEALSRVRTLSKFNATDQQRFTNLVIRADLNWQLWHSEHPLQLEKLAALRMDLDALQDFLASGPAVSWDAIYCWAEDNLSEEGCELVVSLLIESHPEFVDELSDCMSADETLDFRIRGEVKVGDVLAQIEQIYGWAKSLNWEEENHNARVWYVSEEKLEPRLGERFQEDEIAQYEQPLSPLRDVFRLAACLENEDENGTIAEVLITHPEHRHAARRVQIAAKYPYAEIRDNTICAEMLPIDMLRFKLSFFGAKHFDPRSDRWVRINMFAGAPYPQDLVDTADDWFFPTLPS